MRQVQPGPHLHSLVVLLTKQEEREKLDREWKEFVYGRTFYEFKA